jgi:uncharacterized protein YecE (DUF72 family)
LPRSPNIPQPAIATSQPEASPARIHAGTSGWAYPTWKPGFYPEKLPQKRFLEHYATRLTSVEVNYTFRALPTSPMLEGWLAATPRHFRFSFKAPQRITHFSRLAGCEAQVAQLCAVLEPVRAAGRLGTLLFQLPPTFKADPGRLQSFLEAPALQSSRAPRLAFEFRHESWFSDPIYTLLHQHGVALCIADGDDLATPEIHSAPGFTCYRLRRSGGYSPAEIAAFAQRFSAVADAGRELFVYFRHEDEPTGALNAAALVAELRAREARA